jgi:hypothetical protein
MINPNIAMKYIIFFLMLLIANISVLAQDNIQPKWGVSYCYGRVRGYSNERYYLAAPMSKDWTYSCFSAYHIFYIKNIALQIGFQREHTRTLVYIPSTKYPTSLGVAGYNSYLGYSQLVYNFLPSKRISPFLGLGYASRIIDFNTVFGEGGINIQPKYDLPLLIGLKAHLSRAFFSKRMGNYDYLDNVAFGLSVQYSFKPSKNKKVSE